MNRKQFDRLVASYIETALWASVGEDGESLDGVYSADDIAPDSRRKMELDCAGFITLLKQNGIDWESSEAYLNADSDPLTRFGHDFWLTRNHHGAGFWDGDWQKTIGASLTKWAHTMGECNLLEDGEGGIVLA